MQALPRTPASLLLEACLPGGGAALALVLLLLISPLI